MIPNLEGSAIGVPGHSVCLSLTITFFDKYHDFDRKAHRTLGEKHAVGLALLKRPLLIVEDGIGKGGEVMVVVLGDLLLRLVHELDELVELDAVLRCRGRWVAAGDTQPSP